jgi:hypothetical protein
MEAEFEITIDVSLEYEVGSPPDQDIDPYAVANPQEARFTAQWFAGEGGHGEGVVTDATSKLYPPFTDDERRTVFCLLNFATLGTTKVTWNAELFPVGRVFLTTDDGWAAAGVTLTSPGEGSWFACQGELEEDYRKWREAIPAPSGAL